MNDISSGNLALIEKQQTSFLVEFCTYLVNGEGHF